MPNETPNAGQSTPNTPAPKPAPKVPTPGGPRQQEPDPQAASAAERARARKAAQTQSGAVSDSPAAGLSTGKNAIQKTRAKTNGKSFMDGLKEKSRKFNPNVRPVDRQVEVEDSALPGKGPSRVERIEEPEVEALAPAPGETELPSEQDDGVAVSDPVGDHSPGGLAAEAQAEAEAAAAAAAEAGVEGEEEELPPYQPNLNYKAFGKEHAIPELFHGLIDSPENERAVHQVFERAHAMDHFKMNLTQLDNLVRTEIAPEVQHYRKVEKDFNTLIQRGDVFGILGKMGFSKEMVLQAAVEQAKIEQLPPEQRAVYEQRAKAEAAKDTAASQVQQLQTRIQQLESHATHSAIQSTFARGDVQQVAQDFDDRVGKQGAFEQLVRDHGASEYFKGKIIQPIEAVQAVMHKFGLQFEQAAATPPKTPPQQALRGQAAPAAKTPARQTPPPKIIPNVGSRAAAPARSRPQINNVADLRKYTAQIKGRAR